MSTATVKKYSPDEYLALEVRSEDRHEYYRGEIFLMTGGSLTHSRIEVNLARRLANHLEGHLCEVFNCDTRVKVERSGLYTYPDLSIACQPIEVEKGIGGETLLNPAVLIEVLSPTTENYDRGKKFYQYGLIPSFREYLLVSQEEPHIEKRVRDVDGNWKLSFASGLNSSLMIESINFVLRLDEVYARIAFGPPPVETPPEQSR